MASNAKPIAVNFLNPVVGSDEWVFNDYNKFGKFTKMNIIDDNRDLSLPSDRREEKGEILVRKKVILS